MASQSVIVIGSKPGPIVNYELPNLSEIYTTNHAAERVSHLPFGEGKLSRIHSAIAGGREFDKISVRTSITNALPARIILRTNSKFLGWDPCSFPCLIHTYTNKQQLSIQRNMLGLSVYLSEYMKFMNLEEKSLLTLLSAIKRRPIGISTGLFTYIVACIEHPYADIHVTGIGLGGGSHFNSIGEYRAARAKVDAHFWARIPPKDSARTYCNDEDLSLTAGFTYVRL